MICPNCQTPNRDSAYYCLNCGTPLACPRCRSVLSLSANYCDNCGQPLTVAGGPALGERMGVSLPRAALPFAPGVPTLSQAGAAQRAPPPGPSVRPPPGAAQLDRYIPRELLNKLEAARATGSMVGERRVVTMLFCDVKGSTAVAGQLDPEDWSEIMNGVFDHMIKPVYEYEGTVARLMGDAILAFFGAPLAHEDDPQRAVLAGLEIVASLKRHREQIKQRHGLDVDVRVGINTGLVVVGAVGSDMRLEYTALGDAVNVAARMEQTATPGTVQVAADTYKLIAPLFEFEHLGGIEVKGKAEPVPAFRVLGRKVEPGRLRGIAGLRAELVGRDSALAALQEALSGVQQGVGGIVCLVGEAGLGKSRLIDEARARWTGGEWLLIQNLSYETSQPYGLFQRLIRQLNGIAPNEPPPAVREKLAPLVAQFPADRRPRVAQVFEALLAVENGSGQPPLEGESFQRELFDVMSELWRLRFARQPTVLVVDDLHWSDSASVELLLHLLPLTEEIALALLCGLRPDRQAPGWRLKTVAEADFHHRYTEIALRPLSEAESNELVNRLLTVADIPDLLRARILEKGGGNPFFVEEVVRSLIDSGAVEAQEHTDNGQTRLYWRATGASADFNIPDNLQSLLAARIDRLEEATRQALQLASVIGRSFYRRVLTRVGADAATPPEALDRLLDSLMRLEMIQEVARLPEVEYKFRNPLMQEAAYQTILLKRRRDLHRRVGEALEALFPDRLADLAPRLGYHFAEARALEPALKYFTLAGDKAYRLYANQEAIAHYSRALEIAVAAATASSQLAHLYTRKGRALELNSQFADAVANYEQMETLAQGRGDRSLELAALVLHGTIRSTANEQNNPQLAESLAGRAMQLAQELGDEAAESKIQWNLMNVYRMTPNLSQALAAGERSLALARKLNLREQLAFTANDLTHLYMAAGGPERAREVSQEARELWRELGNQPMLADSLGTSCLMHAYYGEFDQAIAFSDEALQISQSIHNLWGQSYSRFAVGGVYWERGEPDRAIEVMEAAIRFGKQAGFLAAEAWTQANLGLAYGHLGQPEPGLEYARRALAQTEKYLPLFRAAALAVQGQLYLLAGNLTEAAAILNEADMPEVAFVQYLVMSGIAGAKCRLALAQDDPGLAVGIAGALLSSLRQFGGALYLPDALHLRGQAFLAAGRIDEARESLCESRAEAERLGSRWVLWQTLASLAEVEDRQGDAAEATDLRRQSREIVLQIAGNIGDPALRASFLNRPGVLALGVEPAG